MYILAVCYIYTVSVMMRLIMVCLIRTDLAQVVFKRGEPYGN